MKIESHILKVYKFRIMPSQTVTRAPRKARFADLSLDEVNARLKAARKAVKTFGLEGFAMPKPSIRKINEELKKIIGTGLTDLRKGSQEKDPFPEFSLTPKPTTKKPLVVKKKKRRVKRRKDSENGTPEPEAKQSDQGESDQGESDHAEQDQDEQKYDKIDIPFSVGQEASFALQFIISSIMRELYSIEGEPDGNKGSDIREFLVNELGSLEVGSFTNLVLYSVKTHPHSEAGAEGFNQILYELIKPQVDDVIAGYMARQLAAFLNLIAMHLAPIQWYNKAKTLNLKNLMVVLRILHIGSELPSLSKGLPSLADNIATFSKQSMDVKAYDAVRKKREKAAETAENKTPEVPKKKRAAKASGDDSDDPPAKSAKATKKKPTKSSKATKKKPTKSSKATKKKTAPVDVSGDETPSEAEYSSD